MFRLAAVLQKAIYLVEQQHCVLILGALDGIREIFLGHAHRTRDQVRHALDHQRLV